MKLFQCPLKGSGHTSVLVKMMNVRSLLKILKYPCGKSIVNTFALL